MFKVAVGLVLVGGAATGVYMYVRMDDQIRRQVEQCLAERYPQMRVSVGGARLVEGRGIAVYDLTLSDPAAPPGADQLLSIDELMLECNVELTTLMRTVPDVQRVEVKHPRLTLRRERSGRWNIASLLPIKPLGGRPPIVVVRGGSLSVSDEGAPQTPPLAFSDIQLTMAPQEAPVGDSAAPGAWPAVRIDGTIGGTLARRIEVHSVAAGPHAPGQATFVVEQFLLGPAIVAWAKPMLPSLVQSTHVSAALDGQIAVTWTGGAALPYVQAELAISGGRLDDPRLPAAVTELTGRIRVQGERQELIDVRGKCGAATVAAALNRTGWNARAPLALAARADNVTLDRVLYGSLRRFDAAGLHCAGALCEQWEEYQPAGVVDASLQATFDGAMWRPAARLDGRHLSFESDEFPYRLTDGVGTITFTPAAEGRPPLLELDVTALTGGGGGQPLHIVGQVFDPRPAAAGWAEITGSGVEIDQAMIDAIPQAKSREVIGQLHPAGLFNLKWRIDRPEPGQPPRTSLTLDLTDVRINYDRFPYPLRNIRGTVRSEGGRWTFTNLVSGGRRTVYGDGYLQPAGDAIELKLQFTAHAAPLDDELFEALAPSAPAAQRAWTELRPRGQVDLRAEVNYSSADSRPRISVAIQPRPETTIRPKFFPYRMDDVAGTITYDDGQVTLVGMRAQHDRTAIRANGDGYFAPEGQWRFRLTGLAADQVTPNPDLVSALPEQLRKVVERLRPSGSFSVHSGTLAFSKSASEIAPLEAEWAVSIDCHQTDLQCGIDLQNIHGSVRVEGRTDRGYSTGELSLESVTFQDIQFTNVRGPIWVNQSKCLLGRWATEAQQKPERRLTGNVYNGQWSSNAWVTFDNLPEYSVELRLVGADLRRIVVERFAANREFTGKVDATLLLRGRGYKLESLVGDGDAHIRDANLYELSLLASLLKMVRTGAADKTAFTQSDIAFRVQGRHILLDQIDFLGDVVNLYGKGKTDFDQNLTLAFSAVIGRHDYALPFVKNLVKQANQQIVQMYVSGTLAEPQVTTEAFPGIAQLLQQIGSELRSPLDAGDERQLQRSRLATQPQPRQ